MTPSDLVLLLCGFMAFVAIVAILVEALLDTDAHQDSRRRNRAGDEW